MERTIQFTLNVPDAAPEAIQAGIDAAWAVFEAHDAWPWDAVAARFDMEWVAEYAPDDAPEMTPEQLELSGVWDDAEAAALAAAWPAGKPPLGSWLGLEGEPVHVKPRYVREAVTAA